MGVLCGGVGRKVKGTITALDAYPALKMMEITITLESGGPGHAAGRFAFVTSNRDEGAHPYTIGSRWIPGERNIVFFTKALGDHTARLPETLQVGMLVTVEGPNGCFTFAHSGRLAGQRHPLWPMGATPGS